MIYLIFKFLHFWSLIIRNDQKMAMLDYVSNLLFLMYEGLFFLEQG